MLGWKSFRTAAVVIGGLELAEKIKKGQLKPGKLGGSAATMREIWQSAWLPKRDNSSITAARATKSGYLSSLHQSPGG